METKDPMILATPDYARELFARFSREATGFQNEDVLTAALNLVINAIRQQHPTQSKAMLAMDEMMQKSKQVLSEQYDSTGRKKGVFPYHQVVHMDFFENKNTIY